MHASCSRQPRCPSAPSPQRGGRAAAALHAVAHGELRDAQRGEGLQARPGRQFKLSLCRWCGLPKGGAGGETARAERRQCTGPAARPLPGRRACSSTRGYCTPAQPSGTGRRCFTSKPSPVCTMLPLPRAPRCSEAENSGRNCWRSGWLRSRPPSAAQGSSSSSMGSWRGWGDAACRVQRPTACCLTADVLQPGADGEPRAVGQLELLPAAGGVVLQDAAGSHCRWCCDRLLKVLRAAQRHGAGHWPGRLPATRRPHLYSSTRACAFTLSRP